MIPRVSQGTQGATGPQGAGLNDISVTNASASGNGSLAYNSGSGVLTFTPPVLTDFLTTSSGLAHLVDVSNAGKYRTSFKMGRKYMGTS